MIGWSDRKVSECGWRPKPAWETGQGLCVWLVVLWRGERVAEHLRTSASAEAEVGRRKAPGVRVSGGQGFDRGPGLRAQRRPWLP